jgi:tetratricopeptide (TPR) repeat protein
VRVVSRTTSMRYQSTTLTVPQIGAELGVDVVIEGSVNRSVDQVRITLQVIDAATDASIETLQIDGTVDDLLGLQEDAAQRVATVIGSTYGRSELGRTALDIPRAAQEAYYRGRYELERRTPDGYQRAVELFEEAVRLAPGFAEARSGLAAARFRLAFVRLRDDPDARAEQYERAEREAAQAFQLDSTSMEVREVYDRIRAARGQVLARAGGTPETAAAAGSDSVSIGVAAVEAMWLATATTLGQQIQETLRDSLLAGPEAATQLTFEARVMMSRGGFSEAAALLDSVVVTYPQTQEAWDQLLRAQVALGHLDQAVRVVERWNAAGASGAPGATSLARMRTAIDQDGARGYWMWRRDYLIAEREAGRPVVLTDLAAAHAALDERNQAYALLEQALQAEESRLYAIPKDPVWDPLRGDPRFRRIEGEVRRMQVETSLSVGTPTTGDG